MHYNKQCKNLIQSKINDETSINFTQSAVKKESGTEKVGSDETIAILSFESNDKKRNTIIKEHETSDIGTCTGNKSCTSSTDSGVNVSDNDEMPPSPTSLHLHSFLSSTSSSSGITATAVNRANKNISPDNNINNNKGNNNNNNQNFNADYNHYYDDDHGGKVGKVDESNIAQIDNKLKSEQQKQQFSNAEHSSNKVNKIRYQLNQNAIGGGNVINISNQHNLATPISTVTIDNVRLSLQNNEYTINTPRRSESTSSSMSSITNSYDQNPSSNMHYQCNRSPVVSIRSIDSTIITSDSDTDSDLSEDAEGEHKSYVIKKLGTQVSYPPEHPDIPNINSGQTVLNQKVIPNADQITASSLAALAAIGDSIGAAQALGPVPLQSAVSQRPQIGSIALNNSSDVTFGDKHFYEGPVTIQQFLIDNRDKWKETNEKENSILKNDNAEAANNAKDINLSTEKSSKLYDYILERKKLIIPGVFIVIALLIVAIILGSSAINDSKSKLMLENNEESRHIIPMNSTIDKSGNNAANDDECPSNGTLCLIERDVWRGHPQRSALDKQILPLHRVIISHTASEDCETIKICSERVRVIQEFHMDSLGWDDIGYNFLISNDGQVYVGRGWDTIGAHTKGYNFDSVGITFIGTYMRTPPTEAQLDACLALIEAGVRLKKLVPDYRLYGARQFAATESPGDMLYKRIKKWQHWSANINLP